MSDRVLIAWINSQEVGRLEERNNLWTFAYTESWKQHPDSYELSPHLPFSDNPIVDGSSKRHVQWYFDNLLPEEGQRILLAKDAKTPVADAFALLTHYGAESAGSLTLLSEGVSPDVAGELVRLTDQELELRIMNLPNSPLIHAARKRMSLAGAQHKLAVVAQGNELFEPTESLPSTHILKPDSGNKDYPHSVINEWFIMQLAGKLGLPVPKVERRYVPSPIYIIDRFDRLLGQEGEGKERIHCIDACQLLGLDRSFKYSQGSIEVLSEITKNCRSPAATSPKLFSWLVFNLLVGNTDSHLKNLSFIVTNEGVSLAPFYDLLSTACYETRAFDQSSWPELTELTWPIFDVKYCCDVDRALLVKVAGAMGIAKTTALRLLDFQLERIEKIADELLAAIEVENRALLELQPKIGLVIPGELRCLRTINLIIIREMVGRLA